MIDTTSQKVQVNQVVFSQLPEFVQEENPLFVDFLETYYQSQEYQGSNIDIVQNFNDYQKVETFSGNENLIGFTTCTSKVTFFDDTINVTSTDGWPEKYGLLKINDEIISYTGKTKTSFTGCLRGFSGVESLKHSSDPEVLVFSESQSTSHKEDTQVINLSNLFLQEFWKNLKGQFLPGFEDRKLVNTVDKANFLRQVKDFYQTKGTHEAATILFKVLFGKAVDVIKPIDYIISPSDADWVVTDDIVVELISGDPEKILGQQLRQTGDNFSEASIFNIRPLRKNNKPYYVISLSESTLKGEFEITGGTQLINGVSIGASVLTVDSTLGFPQQGSFYVGAGITVGIATYTSRSSTQFFGVTGISSQYSDGQIVRAFNTVYSYENGDITKPVIFRMTAVANSARLDDIGFLAEGDLLRARNLGNYSSPSNQRLNSWIHNIKSVSSVSRNFNTNTSNIDIVTNTINTVDPHLLQLDAPVILLDRSSAIPQNVVGTVNLIISNNAFQMNITSGTIDINRVYEVQNNSIFANSNDPKLGVTDYLANIQNTYSDANEKNVYVTTGSLPAYTIHATRRNKSFNSTDVDGGENTIAISNHGYLTGDVVKYKPTGVGVTVLAGLSTNSNYAVTKIDTNTIKLSQSISDASVKRFLDIGPGGTTHEIIPFDLSGKSLQYQNFLRKFPTEITLNDFSRELKNEPIGMFRNGVEIMSNKSGDSIWYGTLSNIEVQNGGQNFDVLNPPNINIKDSVGTGATAYAIVENGKFVDIDILSGGYDLREVPKISITGGNGSGATAVGRLRKNTTVRTFDADLDVSTGSDRVTFNDRHLFENGESVYYQKGKGFAPVGGLVDNSLYYLHVPTEFSVQFMATYDDAVAGINTINLTSRSAGSSTLTATKQRNILDSIVVTNQGSGYSNRRTVVSNAFYPTIDFTTADEIKSGINTANHYVFFKNHGFENGDLVEYSSTGPIIGLSTTQNYRILKLDEDTFRLASAGIGSTANDLAFNKGEYVKIGSIGSASHTFKYPDIHVSVDGVTGLANTAFSLPKVRAKCVGEITACPLTSVGSGYGATDTINVHRRPDVTISNGSRGIIEVIVAEGEIVRAFVKSGGGGYATPPKLEVDGVGKYAELVADVSNGVITSVTIVSSGKGYEQQSTSIRVVPTGSGAKLKANVSRWDINFLSKFRGAISENDDGVIIPSQNDDLGLKYVHAYASRKLRQVLSDNINPDFSEKTSLTHSPILGWAYDGSPIYGPYGFGTPTGGAVRRMVSGYTQVSKGNRPPVGVFPAGTFINDFIYTADGDLDEFNGRFCRTPEFPDGVYAYFCTIQATNSSASPFVNAREPQFPFVLNSFKYRREDFNVDPSSIQTLPILNSGDLVRNTYYYKFGVSNSNYEYLTKNQLEDTELIVRSVNKTGIATVNVIVPGLNYKVGDKVRFNNDQSGGSGATAKVVTLVGKGLSTFSYNRKVVPDVSFTYTDGAVVGVASTPHGLTDHDLVVVGGIGTGELNFIQGPRFVAIASVTAKVDETIEPVATTGIITTISLNTSGTTEEIVVDDTLGIGTETVKVLFVDKTLNRYRVKRETGYGTTHPAGTVAAVDQRKLTYSVGVQTNLTTRQPRKIVFNPQNSVGFGTTTVVKSVVGVGTTVVVRVKATDGTILADHQLPPAGSTADNAITFKDHGFYTGQPLKYNVPSAGLALTVSNSVDLSDPFILIDSQKLFAVRKSKDLLGITTTIAGIGTTTGSLYFVNLSTGTDHALTTIEKEFKGHLERFDVTVKTSSPHTLQSYDKVKIVLQPDNTKDVNVEYDTLARKTIFDPKYVAAATTAIGVGGTDSLISITDHGYVSGEKILYKSGTTPIAPLVDRGEYFVQKINDNQFRLSTTYIDATKFGGEFIGFTTIGSGVHKIAGINPSITGTRGQTVGFAVSDNTCQDLRLDFFEDENFVTRFEGVGISTEIARSGTPGDLGAFVNLKLTLGVPTPLYYKLVPTNLDSIDVSKRDAEPDETVVGGSKIVIENSVYSGDHSIIRLNADEFKYQVRKQPESDTYTSTSGITTFSYLTDSKNALGGVNEVKVTSGGIGYERNPGIATFVTKDGLNALLRVYDDTAGQAGLTEMIKIGYEYPSDKSIQPSVDIPVVVTVSNNFSLSRVGIVTAGRNYIVEPDLIVPQSSEVQLTAVLSGTSVGEVIVTNVGRGFNEVPNPPRIIATRNTNGIGIVSTSSNGDTNTLQIVQPTNGWLADGTDFPFSVGEQIFVEGVGTAQTTFTQGGGYNSEQYEYRFFEVRTVSPSTSKITYSITGIGTTGGKFDPDSSAGRVIPQRELPTFTALLTPEPFFAGEQVTYGANGKAFVLENQGYNSVTNTIRLRSLTAALKEGDVIKGQLSGAEGTVRNVSQSEAFFKTDYFAQRPKGWQRETGKLNNDFQKLEDSDYYQQFSYSLRSEIPYETWKPAVDSIIHPSGYKNFSDFLIPSNTTPDSGIGRSDNLKIGESTPPGAATLSVSIDSEKSFYTRDDFDYGGEETLANGFSKFVTFVNRKIAAFINVKSNKVQVIDNISDRFTGIGTTTSALVVGLSSFPLTTQAGGITLFTKIFDPAAKISIGASVITLNNHDFQTGERIKYDPGDGVYGDNRIAIVGTNVVLGGITTNKLPAEIYAVKLNNNQFSLAGLATAAERGESLVFNGIGTGNNHSLDVLRPDDRVVIQIDGVIQPPLFKRKIDIALDQAVGVGTTTIFVTGITSITANDLVNIDNEILEITGVGVGSTNALKVKRGVLGSVAAAHTVGAACTMRGGSFHIVKDVIHFVTPPYGKVGVSTFQPGISTNSTFAGRVFNRKDPTTNFIFDDVADDFTGVGRTFTLLQDGADVTGIVTTVNGPEVVNQGIILINNIFQRPEVDYDMTERTDPGIGASMIFTGDDRESLPRGGIVDTYTVGFGTNYQPIVAAAGTAIINAAGAIESVVVTGGGSGYRLGGTADVQVLNPLGIGSTAVLSITVGTAGTVTGITTVSGGSGYASTNPPIIVVGLATGYANMQYSGGTGSGFEATVVVGTGGSIVDFRVTNPGIGYKNDEVLTVVGIPTGEGGFSAHTVTVNSIINDKFAGYSFGQLFELDSFADQFDGAQTTFTLTRTTVTKDVINIGSNDTSIDVGNNLLVFLNDILQAPGEAYTFGGGTQITFTEPPKAGSKLQILFFRGSNDDVDDGNPFLTVKKGDLLQLQASGNYVLQRPRRIIEISGVQKAETNLYTGVGINPDKTFTRTIAWTKQRSDLILDNQPLPKSRASLAAKTGPFTRIIQSVGLSSNEIFVENAFPMFSALDNRATPNDVPGAGIVIQNFNLVSRADATVQVSTGGTVFNLTITDGGAGYDGLPVPTVSFASTLPRIQEIGKNWTQRFGVNPSTNYAAITRSRQGLFVAVGNTSGINTSANGVTWNNTSNTTTFGDLKGTVGMTTHVVVVGASGTCGFSTNSGVTFSPSKTLRRRNVFPLVFFDDITVTQDINAVEMGQSIGVAVGAAGTIMFTQAGRAGFGTAFEVTQKFSNENLNGVGANNNVFVIVGDNGTILRSPNGQNFVGVTTTSISTKLNDVKYADNQWIAVGAAGSIIRSTDNGFNWSVVSAGGTFELNAVGYANSVWVAVGQDGGVKNSKDGQFWFEKSVGVSTDFFGLAFGDSKFVAVGLDTSIYSSEFEFVSAAGTATVSAAGTVSAITLSDGGFGYDDRAGVEVLIAAEPVTKELITSVEAEGDYGDVISVASSASGISTTSPMLIFELDSDPYLDQAAFGNISRSGINVGDLFVVNQSTWGGPTTSINRSVTKIAGIGSTFIDNVYVVQQREVSTSGIVTVYCNVTSIAGIGTTDYSPRIAKYSWGRLYNFQRDRLSPQSFTAHTLDGIAGLNTSASITRIKPLSENWNDLDETT